MRSTAPRLVLLFALFALLVALVGSTACTTPGPGPVDPPPEETPSDETPPPTSELQMAQHDFDQDFRLVMGEKAMVTAADGTSMEIRFVRVVGDSRCPRGVECIWEGEAEVELEIHREDRGGADTTVTVHTASSRNRNFEPIPGGWVELMSLSPYPADGIDLDPSEYVATLRVTADEPADDGPPRRRVSDS